MSHLITLTSVDGEEIQFPCEPEQTVQEAAEASGFFPPAICKAGSCGSCLAVCTQGDYQLKSYSQGILPEDPEKTGTLLLCRTYPETDLQLQAPYYADKIQTHLPMPREAYITEILPIADRTMKLVLQLTEDEEQGLGFEFEPGQFVELEVPELDLKRAYSIANTPNWEGRLEFLIRLQEQGQFSTYLQTQAKVGQILKVHGPSGTFTLQSQRLNPRCFVAGGTGLAPFLSMIRRMSEWDEHHPTQLFIGVNSEAEIFCRETLAEIQQTLPQLNVTLCVWKATETWEGFKGTPVDALADYLAKTDLFPDLYLCGPPKLVEASVKIAQENGIDSEYIYCERFT
jgi:ferredoxin-NADP reductase